MFIVTKKVLNINEFGFYLDSSALEKLNAISQEVYKKFLGRMYSFKSIMKQIESLDSFDNFDCMACPGKTDTSSWHIAADGCFKLPRLLKCNQKPTDPDVMKKVQDLFVAQILFLH